MGKSKPLLLFAILMSCTGAFAKDFTKGGIAYNITSSTAPYTVQVTYNETSDGYIDPTYSGAITIPSTVDYLWQNYAVTSIGEHAFSCCTGLTSVTIPNSVTSIGEDAFSYCTGLTSVAIPNSVTSIESNVFDNCLSLSSFSIPNSVTSIGNYAFWACPFSSITIPNSVTSIGERAFSSCTKLTAITIPNSVTSIGKSAFTECSKLDKVNSLKESLAGFTLGTDVFPTGITLNIPFGTTQTYKDFSTSFWGASAEKVCERAVITISSSGCATYCSPKALDFSAVEGLDAYVATSYNSGELTATQHDKMPANTGVLLKGTEGTYVLPEYSGTVSSFATNMFVGINADATVDVTTTKGGDEYTNLVLSVVGGELGFYNLLASGTLAAHKAYLPILTSALNVIGGSKKVTVNFEKGGATGIKAAELNTNSENTIYNLQGQKVEKPEHGIYIVDGKKTYIK